jgi:hypothetical protein
MLLQDKMWRPMFAPHGAAVIRWAAEMFQLLPSSQYHHHSTPGGAFRHFLETASYVVGQSHRMRPYALWDAERLSSDERSGAWQLAGLVAAAAHDAGKMLAEAQVLYRPEGAGTTLGAESAAARPRSELYTPLADGTLHGWARTHHVPDVCVLWLPSHLRRAHDVYAGSFINQILNDCSLRQVLPPAVMKALAALPAARPPGAASGTPTDAAEAFAALVREADRWSAEQEAATSVTERDRRLADYLQQQVQSRRWTLENGVFIDHGTKLLLCFGRLPHDELSTFRRSIEASLTHTYQSFHDAQVLADHLRAAGIIASGVNGGTFVDTEHSVEFTAPWAQALRQALAEALGPPRTSSPSPSPPPAVSAAPTSPALDLRALAAPVDLAPVAPDPSVPATATPVPSPGVVPAPTLPPAAAATPPTTREHAVAGGSLRLAFGDDPSEVPAFLLAVARAPARPCEGPSGAPVLPAVLARRGVIHVFVHTPPAHPPRVYVSSRFLSRWADEAGGDGARGIELKIKASTCVSRVLAAGARDLLWLELSNDASTHYLTLRGLAPQTVSTPQSARSASRPMGRYVAVQVLSLWHQKSRIDDPSTAPHRDADGAIVLSGPLLTQALQLPQFAAADLTVTTVRAHLRAEGIDATPRDGGLHLNVTEIPKSLRAVL